MALAIIKQENFLDIRDLLGGAPSEILPDLTIERDMYAGLAEATIMQRVPDWALIIDDQAAGYSLFNHLMLKKTVVCLTAGLLTYKLQELKKSEDILDYKYVALSPDEWDKIRAQIKGQLDDALGDILGYLVSPILVLSGPTRAQTTCTTWPF